MIKIIFAICIRLGSLSFFTSTAFASMTFTPSAERTTPSVSRRAIICDSWQWIGGSATTWGCLTIPRDVLLASGQATDEVISSLQKQILELEARLQKIEAKK